MLGGERNKKRKKIKSRIASKRKPFPDLPPSGFIIGLLPRWMTETRLG